MISEPDEMWQLDRFDVPGAVLAAPGEPLLALIGQKKGAVRPVDGWRVIDGDPTSRDCLEATVAAPSVDQDRTTWKILCLGRDPGGRWRAGVTGVGLVPRPGRVIRRTGLTLDWVVSPMTAQVGTVPRLQLRLRNDRPDRWVSDGLDSDLVFVWALGPAGERLRVDDSAWDHIGIPVETLRSLEPGESVELHATWQPDSVARLPPGEYPLEACMEDLDLWCSSGVLQLTSRYRPVPGPLSRNLAVRKLIQPNG